MTFQIITLINRWCIIHQRPDKPSISDQHLGPPKTSHLQFSRSGQHVSIVSTQKVNTVTEMGQMHRRTDGTLRDRTRHTRIHFCFSDIMQIWSDSVSWDSQQFWINADIHFAAFCLLVGLSFSIISVFLFFLNETLVLLLLPSENGQIKLVWMVLINRRFLLPFLLPLWGVCDILEGNGCSEHWGTNGEYIRRMMSQKHTHAAAVQL